MVNPKKFYTQTALAGGLRLIFQKLEERLELYKPLNVVMLWLTTTDEIEKRAIAALVGYVGRQSMLLLNLRDALALARAVQA